VAVSRWTSDGAIAPRAVPPIAAVRLLVVALLVFGFLPERAGAEDGPPPLDGRAVAFALQYGSVPPAAERAAGQPGERAPQPRDDWWARDKAKHLAVSTLWTLSTQYVLVAKADWSERDALPVSVASAATVGLAKEVYDRRVGPTATFSWKDLVADAVGIGIGAVIVLV
jgi:uncharacterized protein YfiM (DUF2279 family)